MAGTIVADNVNAASTSTLILKNGVASAPPQFQDAAGTQIGTLCRAWVNFNGTGTVAIRSSFNVTSITDNGVGAYTVNFANAMPDANYNVVSCGNRSAALLTGLNDTLAAPTTGSVAISTAAANGTVTDSPYVNISIFR